MHKKIFTMSTEENTPKSEEDILLRGEEVNDFFTYVEVNDQGGDLKESVPDGEDYVKKQAIAEAIAIASRILADPDASAAVYGQLGSLFHASIDTAKTMEVLKEVLTSKLYITLLHDSDMERAYMQCVPTPNPLFSWLKKPILVFNFKYILPSKTDLDSQVYFLVCKILHEIGHAMTPGLLMMVPGFETVMLADKKILADCGSAVEELAYGGRLRTYNNSAKPYAQPLQLIVRKYSDLAPGPGNFSIYSIPTEYITTKMAELRKFLAEPTSPFPSIAIAVTDRGDQVAASISSTRELAEKRIMGKKNKRAKRNALDTAGTPRDVEDEGKDEDEDEDEELNELVDLGVAYSVEQVNCIKRGIRI